MDFEQAAQRLKRDQSKLKGRRRLPEISATAKREAELQKRKQRQLAAERQRQKRQEEFVEHYYRQCERSLGVKQLSPNGSLLLKATSIHGEGDKVALPPSVLDYLTQSGNDITSGSPWIFRIGIPNPDYSFPASPLLRSMQVPDEDDMDVASDDDEEEEEEADNSGKRNYLDELAHRYLSYTHGSVVEFTQEENCIGLPQPVAAALLDPARRPDHSTRQIPATRTVDPAKVAGGGDGNDSFAMEDGDDEKTPGHLAYSAFDVPDLPIEVSLVHIPKGKACKLVPTHEAVSNGFYNLKDIKLVLEQSLIRTRATLSVGDLVHTWHRGVKFDLRVTEVTPPTYQTVACINTDIEVEFGEVSMPNEPVRSDGSQEKGTDDASEPTGYRLGDGSASSSLTPASQPKTAVPDLKLLDEPPDSQVEGVCTIQIRADKGHGRRRFDVAKATVGDLFAFATTIAGIPQSSFQLVTRFPRKVFLADNSSSATLQEAGLQPGQELLMVEKL